MQRIENTKASSSISKITLFFHRLYHPHIFNFQFLGQATTNLSGWNPSFPLVLGNERTANRGWSGYISELNITDKALKKNQVNQVFSESNNWTKLGNSLLASYQFTGEAPYQDKTGKQPDLQWRGESKNQNEKGVLLSPNHWLETAIPVTSLSESISKASSFTISTKLTSTKKEQTGPARIISLSQ